MRTIPCTLALLLGLSLPARAIDIERIEPGNWWVGMQHNRVELLVHGTGIGASTPRLSRDGVAIVDVQNTDNPNYLFVTLEIAGDAVPGGVDIEFVDAGKVVATHPWRLDAREPGSAQRRGFDARDAIYLVTPDRFANGDPSNDSVPGMLEAANRANPDGRHGGDIAGIRQHLDYIAGM
ncbi:MAG TPA: cyclomaltodextrinase N-terminal domain-containing protein, partial [Thermomonas sp.]|nr:cyclomaltodextrinase N-terminal domain-containing protein [Thermomonas sp.]